MSEHDDRYARSDLPRTTGEFRAAQDISASTAEFKAFAASRDAEDDQRRAGGMWPEQPWAGETRGNPAAGSRRNMIVIGAVVAVLLVVIILIVAVG